MSQPGYVSITVTATDETGVATVSLDYRDAGQIFTTTCGDRRTECIVDGSTYTFGIAAASGTATWSATAVDAAGNVAVTADATQVVDDTRPAATPIALAVDAPVAAGVARAHAAISSPAGDITDATLYFRDARGVTTTRPLCRARDWSLPIDLAAGGGSRSIVVAATDHAGNVAWSPVTAIAAP
jgi:ABC-type Fe2+-enterobactin transport system substrate-binding protein